MLLVNLLLCVLLPAHRFLFTAVCPISVRSNLLYLMFSRQLFDEILRLLDNLAVHTLALAFSNVCVASMFIITAQSAAFFTRKSL